jgi:DNA-binding MarR family transcriptional regulator
MSVTVQNENESAKLATVGAEGRYDLRILNAIRQIIRAADIDSRKLASEHQITAPQLMCLMAIVEKGTAVTATDIAARVHLSPSTLVGVLDRLEDKGLITRTRDGQDRRRVDVAVTDRGRELVSNTPFPLKYSLDKALEQLVDSEREHLAASMERLADLMGAVEINSSPILEIVGINKDQRRMVERNT